MNQNLLLVSPRAKRLYEAYAKDLPVIDYHNHLSLSDLASDRRYTDLYELWLAPDPYKHRAMRMCGVKEDLITGSAASFDKFEAWCAVFPRLIGNPLHIWSQMELETVFGITMPICRENARAIWDAANAYLKAHTVTPSSLLQLFHAETVCPCAAIDDDLSIFSGLSGVVPSLRADSVLSPTPELIRKMESRVGNISSFEDYTRAIDTYLDDFATAGCVFADHAIDDGFRLTLNDELLEIAFSAMCKGNADETLKRVLFSHILVDLGTAYEKRGWTVQLHIGALRKTSTRLRKLAGPAGGYAAIGESASVRSLTHLFDAWERKGGIPKTVLFPLNPADNAMLSVLSGSYSKDGVAGSITLGPAWWWCDHQYGITEVLENNAAYGLLSNFIGMTTDSRSLLSFVRHDYFRRILCSYLAKKLDSHAYAVEEETLGTLIRAMCYQNAKQTLTTK